MPVKLYEDIARHGSIATSYDYPVKVEGRYVMDPSPIPKFDNPKLSGSAALQLFGAGREQRIYALPPYTHVVSLDFHHHPFAPSKADYDCDLCAASDSDLGKAITDDQGTRCSCVPTRISAAAAVRRVMVAGWLCHLRGRPDGTGGFAQLGQGGGSCAAAVGARAIQALWRADRRWGCNVRPVPRRGAGHLATDQGEVVFATADGPRDTTKMAEAGRRSG